MSAPETCSACGTLCTTPACPVCGSGEAPAPVAKRLPRDTARRLLDELDAQTQPQREVSRTLRAWIAKRTAA